MKKIFFLLPDLSAGGAERVTITIARLLHKEGIDVEFINFGIHEGEMLDWIEPEFKIISFGLSRTLQAIPKLHKFMKENSSAIYFSSREHVNLISLISAQKTNSRCVVRIPNMPKNELSKGIAGFKMRIIKRVNKWILKTAKSIIAQNAEMKKQLIEFYGLPERLIHVINNPVDKDYILAQTQDCTPPFDSNGIAFVNICNIAYSKGIDILQAAWPAVKKAIPNAHMYIVGRNTSEYAKTLVNNVQLPDFEFLGFKSNPYPYLKYCDVFVLPSRMEGFPNVVLEAMCFNKPIVATTCVDVIKSIIKPGDNGFYCPIENPEALAQCMIKAVSINNVSSSYDLFDKNALQSALFTA